MGRIGIALLAAAVSLAAETPQQTTWREAIQTCEDKVQAFATTTLRADNVRFRAVRMGAKGALVSGMAALGYGSARRLRRFSCPVEAATGLVGAAHLTGTGRRSAQPARRGVQ
jgi:hypothetical protein